jgi:hypothetical protein
MRHLENGSVRRLSRPFLRTASGRTAHHRPFVGCCGIGLGFLDGWACKGLTEREATNGDQGSNLIRRPG